MAVNRRKIAGWFGLLFSATLALGVWGLATVLFTQPSLKRLWDFSPQARFSVEPATVELLDQVRASGLELEFHTIFVPLASLRVSGPEGNQLRALQGQIQDLTRDLLRRYAYLGGDVVSVTHHDLLREPKAVKAVMREIKNRRYNSVIVKLGDRSKVLGLETDLAEFAQPMGSGGPMPAARPSVPTLKDYKGEEAISTAIKQLLVEGQPKIYFISGYSSVSLTDGIASSYSELTGALGDDGFLMATLDLDAEGSVPGDADAVVLLEPTRELQQQHADLLLGYLRRGGRVLINTRYFEVDSWNPTLRALGERIGFILSDRLVCHVLPDPQNPNVSTSGTPMCQNLIATELNPTHPVTRPLRLRQRYPRFKAGRAIGRVQSSEEGVRLDTTFLRTGTGAWLESEPVDYRAPEPDPNQPDLYGSRCIGAVADIDPETGDRTGHLVLLSASGLDNLSFNFNGDFALNLFNWMTGRDALVSIRGNKYVPRELTLAPQAVNRVFWLMVAGVPGFLLLLGLTVFWRRSRV